MTDLGKQVLLLTENNHILGARVLLRSAIETLALLIFMNLKMRAVISNELSFFAFDKLTMQLLMGSKNQSTSHAAINILTVLEKAEATHEGILELHQKLSESAHPNYDGVLFGYSKTDRENYETHFMNRWVEIFGAQQEPAAAFVFAVFEYEYNQESPALLESLEEWLRSNDAELEKVRNGI